MQELKDTQVRSLGREDPLEEDMATALVYTCWKNPMDRGNWLATVQEVAKSQTLLSNYAQKCTNDSRVV